MISTSEVNSIVHQLETGWNTANGYVYASFFADDADFVHIFGHRYVGKEEIERGHQAIFDTIYKGSQVKYQIDKVRPLGEDAALIFLIQDLVFFPGGKRTEMKARPLLVVERRDGAFKIATVQNTLVTQELPNLGEHPFK
jgi:uncharacterized protein (TIGR02246 family)